MPHPIRLVVDDDRRRSRLTVVFRLLLAIPHFVWLLLWTIAAVVAAVANWFAVLVGGRAPQSLHRFLAAYVRYVTHLYAYLLLAANPFPGFKGAPHGYPVDVEIDPPERQSRWKTALRLVLALPALLLAGVLLGSPSSGGGEVGGGREGDRAAADASFLFPPGVAFAVAFLGWFVCVARAQMPHGFRDLIAYALRYQAQAYGYLFLLTDRYPDSDPAEPRPSERAPGHPIKLSLDDDGRRSRLTVFFRLLLAFPHFVWASLWGYAAGAVVFVAWVVALVIGRVPAALHRFLAAYVRYQTHVYAYLFLVANPFPGFVGKRGTYPVDLDVAAPSRQSRWKTAFRLLLVLPAFLVAFTLLFALFLVALYGWFVALVTGRIPDGLRNLGAFVVRYWAQTNAYVYLVTDGYPYSGPSSRLDGEAEAREIAATA